ncbi:hypothetical protein ABZ614_11440 [Streptomyces sp. NPDC013178]|uniref:hypothetical protein n=1 Tax=Streptomyces sp. NPDC013178 TaxID=3155118 RepID=UPI0033C88269
MVSVAHTTQNIEITAESLEEELHRLEAQRQALERELAAVVAHLGSVQKALGALQDLMQPQAAPASSVTTGSGSPKLPDTARESVGQPASPAPVAVEQPAPPAPVAVAETKVRAPAAVSRDEETAAGKYGRLTEQILDFFATTKGASVRARDVAAALGRDTDAGSINAVRSTLDRLVGSSRIQRAGRGLYRSNPS